MLSPRLVLASILVASDFFCGRYPMGRIILGIKATSGSAPLRSTVYFVCRHMLYGHRHLLAGISTLAVRNKQMLHRARRVFNDDYGSTWTTGWAIPDSRSSTATTINAFFSAPRPRTPSSMPPTTVSSTATRSLRRSRPEGDDDGQN